MKPIKDWGVVQFLEDKVPNAAGDIAGAALQIASGSNPIKVVADLLSGHSDKLSKADMQQAQQLFANDLEREKMIVADRQDARDMQKVALQQDDIFTKRFSYIFGASLGIAVFIIIMMLFFVKIPDSNKRIVDMTIGILVGTGFVAFIQYLWGSSLGSKAKDGHIKALLDKVTSFNN